MRRSAHERESRLPECLILLWRSHTRLKWSQAYRTRECSCARQPSRALLYTHQILRALHGDTEAGSAGRYGLELQGALIGFA